MSTAPFDDDNLSFAQRFALKRDDHRSHASRVESAHQSLMPFKERSRGPYTLQRDEAVVDLLPVEDSLNLLPVQSGSTAAISAGQKAKARDILVAIKTLKALEADRQPATTDERDILSRFGGFGPVATAIFPDPLTGLYKPGWPSLGEELRKLLTPEEYDSARRTTFSQFFTSPVVMEAMHEALARLGVPAGGIVLEPGCGNGRFMTGPHRYIGVELDSLTGRIARALRPDADIRIENFRDSKLPPLDGVIGNVPFANIKLDFKGERLSLHDYFLCKSVDSLKPDGVLAVVTSHFTLDKQNAAARETLAGQADFLGAIRLPSDAFKQEGTAVVTDILLLRKRASGQEAKHADADWLHAAPHSIEGADVPVNRYFLNHPKMVLGDWSRKDTLYAEGYSVVSNGDLATRLRTAIESLPAGQVFQTEAERANPPPESEGFSGKPGEQLPRLIPPPPLRHVTEGSFFVDSSGAIYQITDGLTVPAVYGGTALNSRGTMTGKRLGRLIDLRDQARRVLQSQNEGWPEQNRQSARRDLNHT